VAIKEYQLEKNNKREKVLLLLDNAPPHPSSDILNEIDEFIQVLYLPLNITTLCQPVGQGIIETFKRLYHKELLRKLLLTDGACYMISSSWSELKNVTLERAWLKLPAKRTIRQPVITHQ
jgi:hypothetical protein